MIFVERLHSLALHPKKEDNFSAWPEHRLTKLRMMLIGGKRFRDDGMEHHQRIAGGFLSGLLEPANQPVFHLLMRGINTAPSRRRSAYRLDLRDGDGVGLARISCNSIERFLTHSAGLLPGSR